MSKKRYFEILYTLCIHHWLKYHSLTDKAKSLKKLISMIP